MFFSLQMRQQLLLSHLKRKSILHLNYQANFITCLPPPTPELTHDIAFIPSPINPRPCAKMAGIVQKVYYGRCLYFNTTHQNTATANNICIAGQSGGAIRLLKQHSLYCAVYFAKFEGILGFSVPSIITADLLGNTCLISRIEKVMVCDS